MLETVHLYALGSMHIHRLFGHYNYCSVECCWLFQEPPRVLGRTPRDVGEHPSVLANVWQMLMCCLLQELALAR